MKRILSFLLIVVLVFSLLPISAFAEEVNPAGLEEGEKAAEEPTDGEPADGEPADGEPADGEPADGEPADGEPADSENTAVLIQSIEITAPEESNATLAVGETLQLSATVLPEDADDQSVTWSIDDETVATVDNTGLVTALTLGTVNITATANDGSGISGVITVTVADPVALIDETSMEMTGTGTQEDPYIIHTAEQFETMFREDTETVYYYELGHDLDFTDNNGEYPDFYGHLDGKGHKISNLNLYSNASKAGNNIGLFLDIYGSVKNLTLENCTAKTYQNDYLVTAGLLTADLNGGVIDNVTITGAGSAVEAECDTAKDIYAGLLVGRVTSGTITNCDILAGSVKTITNSKSIYIESFCGGVAGYVDEECTIENNTVGAEVTLYGSSASSLLYGYDNLGGIVGKTLSDITDCTCAAAILEAGDNSSGVFHYNSLVGGIAGYATADITNCTFTGTLETFSREDFSHYTGGIVGFAGYAETHERYPIIKNCTNSGSIESFAIMDSTTYTGGIVGMLNGTVENCSNSAYIKNKNNSATTGGIAGSASNGIIVDCSNSGDIESVPFSTTETSMDIGGIAGYVHSSSIMNCTNSGNLSGHPNRNSTLYAGGIAGRFEGSDEEDVEISNCRNTGELAFTAEDEVALGGIVGKTYDTIRNCTNEGALKIADTDELYIGGIAGVTVDQYDDTDYLRGIYDCENYGHLAVENNTNESTDVKLGGIYGCGFGYTNKGVSYFTVQDCVNYGEIGVSGILYFIRAGGIAGQTYEGNSIYNVVNKGALTIDAEADIDAGGIVGYLTDSILNMICNAADVNVTVSSAATNSWYIASVGGLCGRLRSEMCIINKGVNTGNIISKPGAGQKAGPDSYAGGLFGSVYDYDEGSTLYPTAIMNCYNKGNVTAVSRDYAYAGGIAAEAYGSNCVMASCYNIGQVSASGKNRYEAATICDSWGDISLNNIYYLEGTGSKYDTSAQALTEEQLRQPQHLVGFDFENQWLISNATNNGYPTFIDENKIGKTYTVTFALNDNDTITTTAEYNTTITAAEAEKRIGYDFVCWNVAENGNIWDFENSVVVGDLLLIPQYTPISRTVTYDSQGGSGIAQKTHFYDELIARPSDPKRTNYHFGGWYADEACTQAWDFETQTMGENDITLYARWLPVAEYTATLSITTSSSKAKITKDKGTLAIATSVSKGYDRANLVWSIENVEDNGSPIASISEKGVITPYRNGTVKVTVIANQGDITEIVRTINVKITGQNYGINYGPKISGTSFTLNKYAEEGVEFTVKPLIGDRQILDAADLELTGTNAGKFVIANTETPNTFILRLTQVPDPLQSDDSASNYGMGAKKGKYSVGLLIKTDFEPMGYQYSLSVSITESKPSVKVTVPTVNTFYADETYSFKLTSKSGNVTLNGLADNPSYPGFTECFELVDGKLKLKSGYTKLVTKGILNVTVDGYQPQTVSVTIKTTSKAPKLSLSSSNLTVNRAAVVQNGYSTLISVANTSVTEVICPENSTYTAVAEDGKIRLTLNSDNIASLKKVTANMQIKAEGWNPNVQAKVTVTVTLSTSTPTVSASTKKVTLNVLVPGEEASVKLKVNQTNVAIEDIILTKDMPEGLSYTFEDGQIVFKLTENAVKKTCTVTFAAQLSDGTVTKAQTVTVSIINTAVKVKSSAKGSLNYCDPNSAITYKLTLSNTIDSIDTIELTGENADLFEAVQNGNSVIVKLKQTESGTYYYNQSFSGLSFKITLKGGTILNSSNFSIKPTLKTAKISATLSKSTFHKGVSEMFNTVPITFKTSFGEIESITPVSVPNGFRFYEADGQYYLALTEDNAQIKSGNYTISFNVVMIGQAKPSSTKPVKPTTVKVTCTVK